MAWKFRTGILAGMLGALAVASDTAAGEPGLAARAQGVLKRHCAGCHGTAWVAKGGFGFILDRDKLIARKMVVPGKPDASPLYQQVAEGTMPPKGRPPVPAADREVLKSWVAAGAPPFSTERPRPRVTEADLLRLMLNDLQATPARHRRFLRYVSLAHLHNAGAGAAELQTHRQALAQLFNALSWHPQLARPQALDPEQTLYRIDLRAYQWTARQWERILFFFPYRLTDNRPEARALAAATGTERAWVHGDWLVATASRPPLYYDLLQLPTNERELERLVRVDVPVNLDEDNVARAGFNDSGVARNNRLIERHPAAHGALWRSYDFSENTDRQNLFDHPLGPAPQPNAFVHAGGEYIFGLPNGLHGYFLADGNGRRVEKGPVEIVSDPKRPDRAVEVGVSCMACHARGFLPKGDQVRAHVEKNAAAFSPTDLDTVRAIYPSEARFKALLAEDSARYLQALERLGIQPGEVTPVVTATLRYEATLDLPAAAEELALTPEDFATRLRRSPVLMRPLGALLVPGGNVQRQVFLAALPEVIREFKLGYEARPGAAPPVLDPATGPRAFSGPTGYTLALALSLDGKRALSGGEDRTLYLWDVATGTALRTLEGHADEVLAVAFSPDGRLALSGGTDRTVRLWDLASGRELRRFEGHTDRVSAVAFTPDQRHVVSAGWDQTVRVWDRGQGRETRRFAGHTGWVTSLAVSSDGRRLLSGSYDRTVRVWDLDTGRGLQQLNGHVKEVYSVAFSPDGRRAASGGNDRTVHLWDLATGKAIRTWTGPVSAVIRVAFTADGGQVLAGSSQYQKADAALRAWDAATGKPAGVFPGTGEGVWSVAFSPDGSQALTGSSDKTLKLWKR